MKNIILIIASAATLLLSSCSTQSYMEPTAINTVVEQSEFSFNAKSALPTNIDVLNVMNSLPGTTSNRITTLDSGYGFELKTGKFEVILPYFGRLYNPSLGDLNKNSFRFESTDFKVSKTKNKKGNWIVTINVNDKQNMPTFILEIFKTGSAFLSVSANDRQPISYDGYISNLSAEK
ncbi:DUF4251 domain-containing protein [Soonwooa purpurea]